MKNAPGHINAVLEISEEAHSEIMQKLVEAGYQNALLDYGRVLDMSGIALERRKDDDG